MIHVYLKSSFGAILKETYLVQKSPKPSSPSYLTCYNVDICHVLNLNLTEGRKYKFTIWKRCKFFIQNLQHDILK